MNPLVVDASVALKWLFHEDGRDRALLLLDEYQAGRLRLIAPSFVLAEAGAVLAKSVRRGLLSRSGAIEAFRLLEDLHPVLYESAALCHRALQLALPKNLGYYDCLYLSLAQEHGCDLVTADERFFRAVQPEFATVKLL